MSQNFFSNSGITFEKTLENLENTHDIKSLLNDL